jgi:two-component sensor histidine kinase/ligand-binding sensor domain-containing protein
MKYNLGGFLLGVLLSIPQVYFSQELLESSSYTVSKELYSSESGLPGREVNCAMQDSDGFIWLGTKNGLSRFDGENFKSFTVQNGLQSNIVASIKQVNGNQLLIEYSVPYLPYKFDGLKDLINFQNFQIVKSQNSILNSSIDKIDLVKGLAFISADLCFDRKFVIESGDVLFLSADGQMQVLVSEKNGVWYFERNITVQLMKAVDFFSTKKNALNNIMKDNLGNLWLCCLNGVYKIGLKKQFFDVYFSSSTGRASMSEWNNQIRGISVIENKDVKVVKAVVGYELFSYSEETKEVSNIYTQGDWGVTEIDDVLYYGFFGSLREYDLTTKKVKRITSLQPENRPDGINLFHQLNDSILLVGLKEEVVSFNRRTGQHQFLEYKSLNCPRMKNVYRVFSSSKGVVVVAANGFYFTEGNEITDYFGPEATDASHNLDIQNIVDAQEDSNHAFWIATNGNGLYKWESQNGNVLHSFTVNDGLPSNTLYRLELDDYENIWVGSGDGLFRFGVEDYSVQTFNVNDGLPIHEFNRFSSFKDSKGNLYFGTLDGLVGFSPKEILNTSSSEDVPLRLLGLSLYSDYENRDVDLLQNWFVEKKIVWTTQHSLLKIDFGLLDYFSGEKTYAYRIKGITDDWVFLKHGNLTIASLPYGYYEIEIKAKLQDGTWNRQMLIIPIEVQRPWFFKTWFIVTEILFILLFIFFFIRWRGYKLKVRNENLEKSVLEKTLNLTVALRDKEVLLKELHHRVKNNLQIINGLFELQKDQLTDKKVIEVLNEGQSRLSSIALIHQNFYGGTNLEVIEFNKFLTDLVSAVSLLFESDHGSIECIVHSDDIRVDINIAIPLGLIINELLTNSYKFIPKNQYVKKIEINLITLDADGNCELIYKDNGLGLPAHINFESSPRLGLRLVKGLADQIKGKVSYQYNEGSVFTIHFNGIKKARS